MWLKSMRLQVSASRLTTIPSPGNRLDCLSMKSLKKAYLPGGKRTTTRESSETTTRKGNEKGTSLKCAYISAARSSRSSRSIRRYPEVLWWPASLKAVSIGIEAAASKNISLLFMYRLMILFRSCECAHLTLKRGVAWWN